MTLNNVEIIKQFFSSNEDKTLLINKVNEDIGCFYELLLEEISSVYQIKIDKLSDSLYSSTSNDLFQERRVLLANLTNSKQIDELSKSENQKIIITDYKNFKKYQNN